MQKLVDHIDGLGMTRAAFASKLGISEAYLSQILNGLRKPSLKLATLVEVETKGEVAAVSWVDQVSSPSKQAPHAECE